MQQKILIAALLVAIASVGFEVYSVREMSLDVKQQADEVRQMLLEYNTLSKHGHHSERASGEKPRDDGLPGTVRSSGAVVVAAQLHVLGYHNDTMLSALQVKAIREKLLAYKSGKIDAAVMQKKIAHLYTAHQADFLSTQQAEVLLKVDELNQTKVVNDYAYADMALDLLSDTNP